jgi:hypothetical protein
MSNNLQTSSEPSLSSLMTGIVNDAQELIKQQLTLFKHELRSDLRKAKEASASLALGFGVLLLGVLLLCFMVVHLLNWAFPEHLPLWACYLIVGGVLTLLGGVFAATGWSQFRASNILPEQSAEALKENLEWKTKPR